MNKTNFTFLPERIRQARMIRGITQSNLADLLGVSTQAISQYELGSNNPKPEILDKMCKILDLSWNYFITPMPATDITDNPVFFRKNRTTTKKNKEAFEGIIQWVEEIYYYLQEYINFPPVKLMTKDSEGYSFDDIQKIAKEVRYSWGLGLGPISNITLLLENKGFIIAKIPVGIKSVDACSKLYIRNNIKRPIIFLTEDKSAVRSRRDIAHELGHHVLHSWVDKKYFTNKENMTRIEQEAEWFASAFLMPAETMEREAIFINIERLLLLKQRWGVSAQSLLYHIYDLNLINESKFNSLKQSMYKRKWRINEPLDDVIKHEEPSMLKAAIELILDKVATPSTLLEKIPFPRDFIEKLCGLEEGTLIDKNIITIPNLKLIK
jgi:Zn-dependent peptidase ImmA (M78 family)/DNA-binding XRE family transcriptional regulator